MIHGSEVCSRLREIGFVGILLVRSGNDSSRDEDRYLARGADGMLPKTSKLSALVPELEGWARLATQRCAGESLHGACP